jgi:branched-chain amino acid transport system permease protein
LFLQQIANALALSAVYSLFAIGFTLIFGVLEVITLAHGAVFMMGAFAGLIAVTKFNAGLASTLLVSMIVSGLAGYLIDLIAVGPLRKRKFHHLAPMIATIGCATIITSTYQGIFGAEAYRFPFDFVPSTSYDIGGIQLTLLQLIIISISLFLMVVLIFFLNKTRWGKAVRAVAENPKTAALLGIPVEQVFRLTMSISSAFGGAAGVLTGLNFNTIHTFMGGPILHRGIAVIILGGMGDIRGAMAGGLILGFSEILSVAYISSDFRDAISFGLLFLILLVRPSGIFGKVIERKG